MSAGAITLLLVDDEPALASALERWLRGVAGIEWVGSARDFETGLELARALSPRVVLLDLDLVLMDVPAAIGAMREANPEGQVVGFTGHASGSLIDATLDAGGSGFITKDTDPVMVLKLILAAGAGEIVMCPTATEVRRLSGA